MNTCIHHGLPNTERSGFKWCEKCEAALGTSNRALAASLMGSAKTEKKAQASRENGKKGGRPKKLKVKHDLGERTYHAVTPEQEAEEQLNQEQKWSEEHVSANE